MWPIYEGEDTSVQVNRMGAPGRFPHALVLRPGRGRGEALTSVFQACGWLKDRFGESASGVDDPGTDRLSGPRESTQATLMQRKKLDIKALRRAAD